jgi:cholesterol transport system auxiliary component
MKVTSMTQRIDLPAARAQRFCGLVALATALLVAGCGALPDKPARTTLYDFGPGQVDATLPRAGVAAPLPAIALPEIDASMRLEGTQLLYRLGYADANELKPYAQSRWSLAPAQLLRARLRDALAVRHTVLGPEESATIARSEARPDTLRVSLEEFSHYFASPASSVGLIRLRATLVRGAPGGDRIVAQQSFTVQRPAPSADAAGGVKALAAASDAIVAELAAWVDQPR